MTTTPINNPTNDAKHEIAQAAEDAVKTIAVAAEQAAKVIAAAAAAAASKDTAKTDGDHDNIVKLLVKMEDLKADIKELNDGTTTRITHLENEKLSIKDSYPVLYKKGVDQICIDFELRIRNIESNQWKWIGGISVLVTVITIGVGIILKVIK